METFKTIFLFLFFPPNKADNDVNGDTEKKEEEAEDHTGDAAVNHISQTKLLEASSNDKSICKLLPYQLN